MLILVLAGLPMPVAATPIAATIVALERAALMQVGPNPSPRGSSPLPIPRKRAPGETPAAVSAPSQEPSRFARCVAAAKDDPAAGLAGARAWLTQSTKADARFAAHRCLGVISRKTDWD